MNIVQCNRNDTNILTSNVENGNLDRQITPKEMKSETRGMTLQTYQWRHDIQYDDTPE